VESEVDETTHVGDYEEDTDREMSEAESPEEEEQEPIYDEALEED
jgi:hypothetical protein